MSNKIIEYDFSGSWPGEISCFVLPGAVLFPRGQLPVEVTSAGMLTALGESLEEGRLIGVVQSLPGKTPEEKIFSSGTLARITTFVERSKDHYFLILSGLCRFDVKKEIRQAKGYRRLDVDYQPYVFDQYEEKVDIQDRERLIGLLKKYLSSYHMGLTVEDLESISDDDLISASAMMCPFNPWERQALLESPTVQNRCEMIMAMLELAVLNSTNADGMSRH